MSDNYYQKIITALNRKIETINGLELNEYPLYVAITDYWEFLLKRSILELLEKKLGPLSELPVGASIKRVQMIRTAINAINNHVDLKPETASDENFELLFLFTDLKNSRGATLKRPRIYNYKFDVKRLNDFIIETLDGLPEEDEQTSYKYDDKSLEGIFKTKTQKPIIFEGSRAKIINFFFLKNREGSAEYYNYKDVGKNIGKEISSTTLRLAISEINERVTEETRGVLRGIISTRDKEKEKETNNYRWEIKL